VAEGEQGAQEGRSGLRPEKVAELAKKHSSEAFYALDDPLDAAIFSVLMKLLSSRLSYLG
jgi:hypothetical protein